MRRTRVWNARAAMDACSKRITSTSRSTSATNVTVSGSTPASSPRLSIRTNQVDGLADYSTKMRRLWVGLLLALACWLPAPGQTSRAEILATTGSSRVLTEELDSRLMGRKMPYRIVFPVRYSAKGESGRRFPVLYLLHGLTGHFDNWTRQTKLIDYSAAYNLIIVTPEGENGWYTDNLTKDGDKFESYIIQELIPQ